MECISCKNKFVKFKEKYKRCWNRKSLDCKLIHKDKSVSLKQFIEEESDTSVSDNSHLYMECYSYCRKFYVAKNNYIHQAKELKEKVSAEQDKGRQPDQLDNKKRLRKAGI